LSTEIAKRNLTLGWKSYLLWWCLWMGIGGMLQPVTGDAAETNFWGVKLVQLSWGIGFGVLCAAMFTLAQNTLNVQRKKYVSWANAIVIWMGMKFAIAALTGQI